MKPVKSTMTVLKQVVDQIPAYLLPKPARKPGIDKKSRSFTGQPESAAAFRPVPRQERRIRRRRCGSILS